MLVATKRVIGEVCAAIGVGSYIVLFALLPKLFDPGQPWPIYAITILSIILGFWCAADIYRMIDHKITIFDDHAKGVVVRMLVGRVAIGFLFVAFFANLHSWFALLMIIGIAWKIYAWNVFYKDKYAHSKLLLTRVTLYDYICVFVFLTLHIIYR